MFAKMEFSSVACGVNHATFTRVLLTDIWKFSIGFSNILKSWRGEARNIFPGKNLSNEKKIFGRLVMSKRSNFTRPPDVCLPIFNIDGEKQ